MIQRGARVARQSVSPAARQPPQSGRRSRLGSEQCCVRDPGTGRTRAAARTSLELVRRGNTLAGAREGKAADSRRSEIRSVDRAAQVGDHRAALERNRFSCAYWTLPAARAKNKREHVVPLGPAAMAIIQSRNPYAHLANIQIIRSRSEARVFEGVTARLPEIMNRTCLAYGIQPANCSRSPKDRGHIADYRGHAAPCLEGDTESRRTRTSPESMTAILIRRRRPRR